jgi:hypothetical protein
LNQLNRALELVFLRLYAKNLSRSSRSDPANACSDTEIQMSTILILAGGLLVLLIGSLLFPEVLLGWLQARDPMFGFLLILTIVIAFLVHLRFGKYELSPELAEKYKTAASNRWTTIVFWSGMGSFLLVTLLAIQHMRSY